MSTTLQDSSSNVHILEPANLQSELVSSIQGTGIRSEDETCAPCYETFPRTASWSDSRVSQEGAGAWRKLSIARLATRMLKERLDVVVEGDAEGFIARAPDLPMLYGFDDDNIGAVESLKREIESLYEDLMRDDNFTPDWSSYKDFLRRIVE